MPWFFCLLVSNFVIHLSSFCNDCGYQAFYLENIDSKLIKVIRDLEETNIRLLGQITSLMDCLRESRDDNAKVKLHLFKKSYYSIVAMHLSSIAIGVGSELISTVVLQGKLSLK